MALITPSQQITINPFDDHRFSNTINRLTRIITGTKNLILPSDNYVFDLSIASAGSQVINDSTQSWGNSQAITISPGVAIKDDALIHITESATLDFTEPANYVGAATDYNVLGPSPSHPLKYLILLKYTYYRSYPQQEAAYVICKDRAEFFNNPTRYLYLGSATVELISSVYKITEIAVRDVNELDSNSLVERPIYKFVPPVIKCEVIE